MLGCCGLLAIGALGVPLRDAQAAPVIWVTTTRDDGDGSLREAIRKANVAKLPVQIRFDSRRGPFAAPQTIRLDAPLPPITGSVEIDGYIEDRLWQASGITIDAQGRHRAFEVVPGARFRLRYLSIRHAVADRGAAVFNRGETRLENLLLMDNRADRGGAVAQEGGQLWLINASLVGNTAADRGGGLDLTAGTAVVIHCSFHHNRAPRGAGIHSAGDLRMANSILAGSSPGADCEAVRGLDRRSTHNLIRRSEGCGVPLLDDDPRFGELGPYNGPTLSLPLMGGSPAINRGDNASAVDADGAVLRWDQRGNGDPRNVAGIVDIGSFEVQAQTVLEVDTAEDLDLRGCTVARNDCSLRGAIALFNAGHDYKTIGFSAEGFSSRSHVQLLAPLPAVQRDLELQVPDGQALRIAAPGLSLAPGAKLRVKGGAVEVLR